MAEYLSSPSFGYVNNHTHIHTYMVKNNWKNGYIKTWTTDSVQNISFIIDRTFQLRK